MADVQHQCCTTEHRIPHIIVYWFVLFLPADPGLEGISQVICDVLQLPPGTVLMRRWLV
jgi:hypothetical protein